MTEEYQTRDESARYEGMTDEEIAALSRDGDGQAMVYLMDKYKNFVRSKARGYFLVGADHEDIVQEGMIGLFKAVRDYDPARLVPFRVFAELCVRRQLITAIKNATRQKHIPLNNYVSLNKPVYESENGRTLHDVVEGRSVDPEELFISAEETIGIRKHLDTRLTALERNVLDAFLRGESYQEIAEHLGTHVKAVDNALQRVKKKLLKYLNKQHHDQDQL